ncbi:MAG: hypothetical protein ABIH00_01120 [Armatimonadota bacterium]
MKVLKGILSESKKYYLDIKNKIKSKLAKLPKGSVKERKISGGKYYYMQNRVDNKVKHKYLGKSKPVKLLAQIKERKKLETELKKVEKALKLLKKSEGKKND